MKHVQIGDFDRAALDRAEGSEASGAPPQNGNWQPVPANGTVGGFGIFLFVLGLALLGYALFWFNTAPSGTHNLGLLNQQLGFSIAAGSLAICGSVFFAAERIVHGRS